MAVSLQSQEPLWEIPCSSFSRVPSSRIGFKSRRYPHDRAWCRSSFFLSQMVIRFALCALSCWSTEIVVTRACIFRDWSDENPTLRQLLHSVEQNNIRTEPGTSICRPAELASSAIHNTCEVRIVFHLIFQCANVISRFYHSARLRWNSLDRIKSPLHDQVIEELTEWALFGYSSGE
jgi:hypothetical protein